MLEGVCGGGVSIKVRRKEDKKQFNEVHKDFKSYWWVQWSPLGEVL